MSGAAFTGDFDKLRKLTSGMGRMRDFMKPAARLMGEEALSQVQKGFVSGTDPYGRAWLPVRGRPGGRPLRDTGRLMNSFSMHLTSGGFIVGSNLIYASVHQYGAIIKAKNAPYLAFRIGGPRGGKSQARGGKGSWVKVKQVTIPARPFLPNRRGLGRWKPAMVRVLKDLRRERLGF